MSNEKITKKEMMEELKEYELSDGELDSVAGGGDELTWFECVLIMGRNNASREEAIKRCNKLFRVNP